jgi:hypothetical protein
MAVDSKEPKASSCIIIFAKAPVPGQVKTRLTSDLSPKQASAVYQAFLTDWHDALSKIPAVQQVIAYTPPEALSVLQSLIGARPIYIPQVDGNLGARLIAAAQWAHNARYQKILIVGSDSPSLPVQYIKKAFDLLDSRDVVVGPSVDGGYYLIGFSHQGAALTLPGIFEDIDWSTSVVFHQTLAKIESTQARLGLLPPWYDVDSMADLRFLLDHLHAMELAGEEIPAPRTYRELLALLEN